MFLSISEFVTRNSRHASSSTFRRLFFVYAAHFLRRLCIGLALYRRSSRAEHLLIYRIQSHTYPKRRKFSLKQAGQKSVKEDLPEQRKAPKRAVECQLKVQTHIWEQEARGSSPRTPTTRRKRHIACDELFHFIAKLIARSFCRSPLPTAFCQYRTTPTGVVSCGRCPV